MGSWFNDSEVCLFTWSNLFGVTFAYIYSGTGQTEHSACGLVLSQYFVVPITEAPTEAVP